jgi:hypothetical protein
MPRYTDKQIENALVKSSGLVYLAAKFLKCTPLTIYTRMKKNKVLKAICNDCRGEIVDLAEQKLKKAVKRGDAWAITMVLRTLGRRRGYVSRQEIARAGDSEVPSTFEEWRKIIEGKSE